MERGKGGVLLVCVCRVGASSSSAAALTDPTSDRFKQYGNVTLLVRMEPYCCCLHLSTWVQICCGEERLAGQIFVS